MPTKANSAFQGRSGRINSKAAAGCRERRKGKRAVESKSQRSLSSSGPGYRDTKGKQRILRPNTVFFTLQGKLEIRTFSQRSGVRFIIQCALCMNSCLLTLNQLHVVRCAQKSAKLFSCIFTIGCQTIPSRHSDVFKSALSLIGVAITLVSGN